MARLVASLARHAQNRDADNFVGGEAIAKRRAVRVFRQNFDHCVEREPTIQRRHARHHEPRKVPRGFVAVHHGAVAPQNEKRRGVDAGECLDGGVGLTRERRFRSLGVANAAQSSVCFFDQRQLDVDQLARSCHVIRGIKELLVGQTEQRGDKVGIFLFRRHTNDAARHRFLKQKRSDELRAEAVEHEAERGAALNRVERETIVAQAVEIRREHGDEARVKGIEVDDELEEGPERLGAKIVLERNDESGEFRNDKVVRETGENGARLDGVAGQVLGAQDGKGHVDRELTAAVVVVGHDSAELVDHMSTRELADGEKGGRLGHRDLVVHEVGAELGKVGHIASLGRSGHDGAVKGVIDGHTSIAQRVDKVDGALVHVAGAEAIDNAEIRVRVGLDVELSQHRIVHVESQIEALMKAARAQHCVPNANVNLVADFQQIVEICQHCINITIFTRRYQRPHQHALSLFSRVP